jgi:hypothetical protein
MEKTRDSAIEQLEQVPALSWKRIVRVLGAADNSAEAIQARERVRQSALARALIDTCACDRHAYKKWDGAHWVVALLADLGYPPGDDTIHPLMDKTIDTWISAAQDKDHVRMPGERPRRHASQEGNAVWSSLRLGFADGRTDELVGNLLKWRWPDGGWNCDQNKSADTSSFMETLIPLRALALYAQVTGDRTVREAAAQAAEVFLCRRLFRRLHNGILMDHHFTLLHYPPYWHYDILFGLHYGPALRRCPGPA